MKAKYIVMAIHNPAHVIVDAYKVKWSECIIVTKDHPEKICALLPTGMKILRYRPVGDYDIDKIVPIPDDIYQARLVRDYLIREAKQEW